MQNAASSSPKKAKAEASSPKKKAKVEASSPKKKKARTSKQAQPPRPGDKKQKAQKKKQPPPGKAEKKPRKKKAPKKYTHEVKVPSVFVPGSLVCAHRVLAFLAARGHRRQRCAARKAVGVPAAVQLVAELWHLGDRQRRQQLLGVPRRGRPRVL